MNPPLDETGLSMLHRLVERCRDILTRDLGGLLEGRFGIRPDGTTDPPGELHLDNGERATWGELCGIFDHYSLTEAPREARRRLLREAVFTHLNRLVAIRIAEAHGLLPESIGGDRTSRGFRDIVTDVAPLLDADDTGGYWTYLLACGDELAADAPVLFDPRNPLLALAPSAPAFDQVIGMLAAPAHAGIWRAPDALGWAYQFFNSDEERRGMRRSGAPKDWRELAVRNQFFTPGYVVRYLVHNTLGRRLVEAGRLPAGELEWLVDPPAVAGPPLELAGVRVLDPACGSGHFLLGAYDVLERAWFHAGLQPAAAAPDIVGSLWGIDIDPRAVQVAAAAIMLRARQAVNPILPLPSPNVVCAQGPLPPNVARAGDLPPSLEGLGIGLPRRLLDDLGAKLERAPELGALLQVEGLLQAAERIHVIAQEAADRATSTPADRLIAAGVHDVTRFLRALDQRYDAVLMNPPFGEPVTATRDYLKGAYPWIPAKDCNLLTAFVGRGLQLCDEHGYVGAITSRAALLLTTFERWRREVVLGNRLVTLADLGSGVMKDSTVEAAAYVIGWGDRREKAPVTFVRLAREPAATRGKALRTLIERSRSREPQSRVFRVIPAELGAVPGSPIAYWMSPSIRRLFTDFPSLEGHGAEVRQGLATGDDFRFVRAFWEVDPRRIARTREETFQKKRWAPFAKGGEYSPFWSDIHLVVDWERDGDRLRQFKGAVMRNTRYYFQPGLTWPLRTQAGFNPRILPAGCVFGHKGPGMFPKDGISPWLVLGLLLSRPAIALLETVATFGSYEVGAVARLPWPEGGDGAGKLVTVTERIARFKAGLDQADETTRRFVTAAHPSGDLHRSAVERERARLAHAVELLEVWAAAEHEVAALFELEPDAVGYLDRDLGPLPTEPWRPAEGDAPRPRWVDLEIETAAAGTGQSVRSYLSQLDDARLTASPRVAGTGRDLLSYLIGCAFGRWDVRIGREPSLAPPLPGLFDPVLVCPPGMLVGLDGMPATEAPPGYPLHLPPHGLLIDEPGHRSDIVVAVEAAAAALFDDPDRLAELCFLLGRELREHLRRQFFKDHLARYTKSRRKAPIYWPLTVASHRWGVWVYAPALTRETLFAIETAADVRLHAATAETRRLEAEQLSGSDRSPRQLTALLEAERRLAEELRLFQREAARIAHLGWAPDLDDGIVLCAAPLADLFPDWKSELAARRLELKRGAFPWASLHRYREGL